MKNNDIDIPTVEGLAKLLLRRSDKLVLPKPGRLIYEGNQGDIDAELKSLGVFGVEDPDGIVINLATISKNHIVVFIKWIDQVFTDELSDQDTIFLDLNGDFAIFTQSKVTAVSNDVFKNKIENVLAYYRVKRVLKNELVCDHHNIAERHIVFYSSTKGIVKITYLPHARYGKEEKVDLIVVALLVESVQNPAHKIHFVNGIFKISGEKPIVELASIVANAELLITIIKRDYEITLKQFDFDKFKDNLLKEKDKYFNTVREIVNKVFGQLIGIPISISASAFASYKVENESSTLVLILLGFLFYVILYVKIQLSYFNDLTEIKTDFDRDFENIKLKSGLDKELILTEHRKVHNKIAQTKSMIKIMIGGICVLGGSFILYLSDQLISTISGFGIVRAIVRLAFEC